MRAAAASVHSGRSGATAAGKASRTVAPASTGSSTTCGQGEAEGGSARAGQSERWHRWHRMSRLSRSKPWLATSPGPPLPQPCCPALPTHPLACSVDQARAAASTAIAVPISSWVSSGVAMAAASMLTAAQGGRAGGGRGEVRKGGCRGGFAAAAAIQAGMGSPPACVPPARQQPRLW